MSVRAGFDMQQVITPDYGGIRVGKQSERVTGFVREIQRNCWFIHADSYGTYTGLLEFWKLFLYAS